METSASRIQVSILFILFVKVLAHETTTSATTQTKTSNATRPEPFKISTQLNVSDSIDTSADESLEVENRHLYDAGKELSIYEPHSIKARDKVFNSSSSNVEFHPRKTTVIQAIPKKAMGIGTLTNKSPSGGHKISGVKDFGSGEPPATIVYATSIPTSMPTRTFVNIRPVLHSSKQQHNSNSFVIDYNIANNNHRLDALENHSNMAPVEHSPSNEEDDSNFRANGDGNEKQYRTLIVKKPIRRIESLTSSKPSANETIRIAVSSGMQPSTYQTEQTRGNVYKSFPYSKIRTNEDTKGELFSLNQRLYRIKKLTTHPERGYSNLNQLPTTLEHNDSGKTSDFQRDYHNHNNSPLRPYPYRQHQTFAQSQYLATPTEEHPNQGIDKQFHRDSATLTAAMEPNQCAIHQDQQYQPLTVRDFDLLLQLLVLREQRLNPCRDQYHSVNCPTIPQDPGNNYLFNLPKTFAFMPEPMENPLSIYRRREPVKEMENFKPRIQPASRQLPPNIREELLFRMLLLALHLQPQPQLQPLPQHQPHSLSNPQSQHIYQLYPHNSRSFFPRDSEVASYTSPDISSQAGAIAPGQSVFTGFQYSTHRNANLKNPIRSVQVLGEID